MFPRIIYFLYIPHGLKYVLHIFGLSQMIFVPLLYDYLELSEIRNLEIHFYSIRPGFLTCLLNIIRQPKLTVRILEK